MVEINNSRKKILTFIFTGSLVFVFALVVLGAALSPPTPEHVVSDILAGLADQDLQALEENVTQSVQRNLQAAVLAEDESRWQLFWSDGPQLFEQFRIDEVSTVGDQAVVTVYYGPGLIQAADFILLRVGKRWKVSGISD